MDNNILSISAIVISIATGIVAAINHTKIKSMYSMATAPKTTLVPIAPNSTRYDHRQDTVTTELR